SCSCLLNRFSTLCWCITTYIYIYIYIHTHSPPFIIRVLFWYDIVYFALLFWDFDQVHKTHESHPKQAEITSFFRFRENKNT
ncbi:LOW QUALITY PROTEIN: hypothetical protein TorRG33x02_270980, partial [Trema orientale]